MFIIENVCKSNVLSSFSRRTFIKTASAIHQFPTILFSKIGTQFGSHTERNLAERKCRHSLYSKYQELKIGTQCVHVSTATYLQMKQCKFTCNDANTVRYTENIRRENDAFNVKIKALLQNESHD